MNAKRMPIMTNPGVYQIKFSSGHYYIGSAANVVRRHDAHFRALRKNVHKNWKLQDAFNANGMPEFSILMEFDTIDGARDFEDFLLRASIGDALTLNLCFDARGALLSEESRALISKSLTGRVFTDQHRSRISVAITGRPYSTKTRAKIGAATASRRHTEATKNQISQSLKKPRRAYATSDRNLYEFEHIETGEHIQMQPYEMRQLIGSTLTAFGHFIHGKTINHKGWRLIKKVTDPSVEPTLLSPDWLANYTSRLPRSGHKASALRRWADPTDRAKRITAIRRSAANPEHQARRTAGIRRAFAARTVTSITTPCI